MSTFLVILLAVLAAGLIACGAIGIPAWINEDGDKWLPRDNIAVVISLLIGMVLGLAIPAWCDEGARVYVSGYLAEKYTIEMSLESEELSGLERIELVRQAAEANKELAEKKARFERWHHATYDRSIYDDVELIDLGG